MNFDPQLIYPTHPLLKKHIAYYYLLKTDSETFNEKYFAFPHINTVLNIHNGANAVYNEGKTSLFGDGKAAPIALVQGIRDFPLLANLSGVLDKVTIVFKPMGINHFISETIAKVCYQASVPFNEWDCRQDYVAFLQDFFTANQQAKPAILEAFLFSCYREVPDLGLMETAIKMLTNFETELPIAKIAEKLNLTERTLNRYFNRFLGVSPATYKKVARFRHSLENQVYAAKLKRMTEVAHQSSYYDQAYFNKVYKKMTGSNPQHFFNKVDKLADNNLIFLFEKNKIV